MICRDVRKNHSASAPPGFEAIHPEQNDVPYHYRAYKMKVVKKKTSSQYWIPRVLKTFLEQSESLQYKPQENELLMARYRFDGICKCSRKCPNNHCTLNAWHCQKHLVKRLGGDIATKRKNMKKEPYTSSPIRVLGKSGHETWKILHWRRQIGRDTFFRSDDLVDRFQDIDSFLTCIYQNSLYVLRTSANTSWIHPMSTQEFTGIKLLWQKKDPFPS